MCDTEQTKAETNQEVKIVILESDDRECTIFNCRIRNVYIVEYGDSESDETYAVILQNPSKSDAETLDETTKNALKILQNRCRKIIFFNILPIYASNDSDLKAVLSNVNEESFTKLCLDNVTKIKETLEKHSVQHILLSYGDCNVPGVTKIFDEQIKSILQVLHSDKYRLECVALNKSGKKRPIHLSTQAHAVNIYKENQNKLLKLDFDEGGNLVPFSRNRYLSGSYIPVLDGGYLLVYLADELLSIVSIPSPNLIADNNSQSTIENDDAFEDKNGNEYEINIYSSMYDVYWELVSYPEDDEIIRKLRYEVRLNEY